MTSIFSRNWWAVFAIFLLIKRLRPTRYKLEVLSHVGLLWPMLLIDECVSNTPKVVHFRGSNMGAAMFLENASNISSNILKIWIGPQIWQALCKHDRIQWWISVRSQMNQPSIFKCTSPINQKFHVDQLFYPISWFHQRCNTKSKFRIKKHYSNREFEMQVAQEFRPTSCNSKSMSSSISRKKLSMSPISLKCSPMENELEKQPI